MSGYGSAVVLLSGGIDSAVAAAMVRPAFAELHAITVDYGQVHALEVEAARNISSELALNSHQVITAPCFPESPLTGAQVIGACIVPARNLVLLSIALSHALYREAEAIIIGCNASDLADYSDCRPGFLRAFEETARVLDQTQRIQILAPCGGLDKAGVLAMGSRLGVPLGLTVTCYQSTKTRRRCQTCNACKLLGQAEARSNVVVG